MITNKHGDAVAPRIWMKIRGSYSNIIYLIERIDRPKGLFIVGKNKSMPMSLDYILEE